MQLELPIVDDAAPRLERRAVGHGRVFVNRDLKMSQVAWVGFDMDYTLAIYQQEAMDRLSIEATVEKLVARGYPPWLRDLHYPLDFAIRGLLVDKHLGNILKLNRFKIVRKGYHGLKELSRNELRALYYERKLRHKSTRYHWIDTLYALSEACMFATIVEAFDERKQSVKYSRLFNDIRGCIDEAHRDGTILRPVMANPDAFLEPDPALAQTLHRLRSAGKRLFLLTNSGPGYTRVLLRHLLEGQLTDYPTFQHYFDAIICSARKPVFFQERNPLLVVDDDDQTSPAALPLERGRLYQGGNLRLLEKALAVTGNRVLYIGDHIYGDMLRSKKDSAWRTAMVIPELEAEITAHQAGREEAYRWSDIEARRLELDEELREHQRAVRRAQHAASNGSPEQGRVELAQRKQHLSAIRRQLRSLDREARNLRRGLDRRFHPYWGSLLKDSGELSLFGSQVNDYACIYVARVSNLGSYSPNQYYRSPHNLMHHEL